LERRFLKQFKKTPKKWTRELQCRMAVQLISLGWLDKEIAAELHFSNSSHFCHEFKKVMGITPKRCGFGLFPNFPGPAIRRPSMSLLSNHFDL
jgi:AraC-like DNA-binding protein